MPIFAIIARDRTDAGSLRAETREAHRGYLHAAGETLLRAGPMLDDAGTPTGSILFVEVPDRAAADAFAAGDPYARAGLFGSVEVAGWRHVLP